MPPQDTTGQLVAIYRKRMRRGPMDAIDQAILHPQRGLEGNADQGGRRQITLLELEVWEQLMAQFGAMLLPARRRANLLLRNIRLAHTRHKVVVIGSCRIRILGETKPCERMDEALPGLKAAMYAHWAGGAFGEVLEGGKITVGDVVCMEDGGMGQK